MTTKPKQTSMFNSGEELPLFSGTPTRAAPDLFDPQTVNRQITLFKCTRCFDAGFREIAGKIYPCKMCQAGQDFIQSQAE